MFRIRGLLWIVVLLCLYLSVGVTTSVAATSASENAEASLPGEYEMRSLAREMQLPLSRVEADVSMQRAATGIVETLRASLGSSYAGLWFDNQTSTFHVMTSASSDEPAIRSTLQRFDIATTSEIEVVSLTEDQLRAAATRLEARLKALLHPQEALVELDLPADSLTLALASTASTSELEGARTAAEGLPDDPPVTIKPLAPAVLHVSATTGECSFPNCNLPVRGGVRMFDVQDTAECTTGFFVKDANNYPYVLTAGHCLVKNDEAWAIANAENTIGYRLGIPIAAVLGEGKDAGVVESTTYVSETDLVVWAMNGPDEVTGVSNANYYVSSSIQSAYDGMIECHIGKTSGTECGEVLEVNKNAEVNYEGSYGVKMIEHTDRLCALVERGDSGGPAIYNHRPTAITIAGNLKQCGYGGFTIVYEIKYAMEDLGVHLPSQ